MPILTAPATLEDFQKVAWKDAISKSADRTCAALYPVFFQLGQVNGLSPGEAASIRMLLYVSGTRLSAERPYDPLSSPYFSDTPDANDIAFLREIKPLVDHPELRSRIADLLWLFGKTFADGLDAIDNYIEAGKAFIGSTGFEAVERLERAIRLSALLRQPDKTQVAAQIVRDILFEPPKTLTFVTARFAELLLLAGWSDPEECGVRCVELASQASEQKLFHLSRRFLEIGSESFAAAKLPSKNRETLLARAEKYVDEALLLASTKNISFGQPEHLIASAIEALRHISGTRDRVEELHRLRDEYKSKFVQQMIPLSEELNVDEISKRVRQHINRSNVHEAIFMLARIHAPRKVEDLANEVTETSKKYVLQQLFATTMNGATGRTAANAGPVGERSSATSPEVEAAMFRTAAILRQVPVMGLIDPARNQIMEQHGLRTDDLGPFIWDNPLVPVGREQILMKGLLAGFEGDFITSTHLIIPQLEHIIRELLYARGRRTSTYTSEGIEHEHDLNRTLRDPELTKILGADLVFDLRGLLIEPFGSNLRNEMAHGMRNQASFITIDTVYCWWITLYLLCLPLKRVVDKSSEASAPN